MYRCNATVRPPWAGMLTSLPVEDVPHEVTWSLMESLVCELGCSHRGEHAAYLAELDPETQLWVMWENGRHRFTCVRPCEMADPTVEPVRREACTLFVAHSPGHSWQFRDLLHG